MNTAQLLKQAREERAATLTEIEAYKPKIEARTFVDATDGPALDALSKKLESQESECRRLETLLDIEARSTGWSQSATGAPQPGSANSTTPGVTIIAERGDSEKKAQANYRMLKAVSEIVGGRGLTGLEAEMQQEALKEGQRMGLEMSGNLQIPQFLGGVNRRSQAEQRDMLAGTTTAGGYTIQTDVQGLIPILQPRLTVEALGATMLTGLTGNIDFPRNDADAAAVWATEVATATETSPTFDRLQMSPKRLAAFTDISRQVMIQSTIDMENFIRRRLSFAVAKAVDLSMLSASTSNGPTGIPGVSGVSTVSVFGNLTWAQLIAFETAIATENADYGRLAYLIHPTVAGKLKSTLKASGTSATFLMEGPNNGTAQINGYRALTSTQVPVSSSVYNAYFGNWEELMIGQWGGLDIMVNPYTKAKEATVEIVVNSFWDGGVRHAKSFCISTNVTAS
jgi:HK97 family phage major capsid protein